MVSLDEAYKYLKDNLQDKRFIHTLGVISVAKKLAVINGESEDRAEIAALCHDIAKNVSISELEKIINDNSIQLTEDERNTKELWHSIIGPIFAREKLGIEDEEILSAIRWHTTGKDNMTTLEKIIFIADMIEPSRVFDGVDEIRKATISNLDRGVLIGLSQTIKFLIEQGKVIDINTIKARNYLISRGNHN